MSEATHRCARCRGHHDLGEFPVHPTSGNPVGWCRSCRATWQQQYHELGLAPDNPNDDRNRYFRDFVVAHARALSATRQIVSSFGADPSGEEQASHTFYDASDLRLAAEHAGIPGAEVDAAFARNAYRREYRGVPDLGAVWNDLMGRFFNREQPRW